MTNDHVPSDRDDERFAARAREALRSPSVHAMHRRTDRPDGPSRRVAVLRGEAPASAPRALVSRRRRARALVSGVSALLVAGAAAWLGRPEARVVGADALRSVLVARAAGTAPDRAVRRALERALGDPALASTLARDPDAPAEWDRVEALLDDIGRAPVGLGIRALAPRGAVVATEVRFAADVAGVPSDARVLARMRTGDGRTIDLPFPAVGVSPRRTVRLPDGRRPADLEEAVWTVVVERRGAPPLVAPPARFRLVPAAVRDGIVDAIALGDPELDAVARAAALLRADLADDALERLRAARSGLAIARLLEAEALARLDRRDELRALRAQSTAPGSPTRTQPAQSR